MALFLGCLFECTPSREPPTPQPPVPPDTDLCGAMCQHFRDLKCEEGQPLYDSDLPGPRGTPNLSCEAFCQKTHQSGVYLNPTCELKITACSQIESARQKLCPRE